MGQGKRRPLRPASPRPNLQAFLPAGRKANRAPMVGANINKAKIEKIWIGPLWSR
jgi:hypothetical protein